MKKTEFLTVWQSVANYYSKVLDMGFTDKFVMPLFLDIDVSDFEDAIKEYLANNSKAPTAADILFIIKHKQGTARSDDEMEHDARVVWNQLNDLSWSSTYIFSDLRAAAALRLAFKSLDGLYDATLDEFAFRNFFKCYKTVTNDEIKTTMGVLRGKDSDNTVICIGNETVCRKIAAKIFPKGFLTWEEFETQRREEQKQLTAQDAIPETERVHNLEEMIAKIKQMKKERA